jgi:hypothetical protein
MLHNSVVQTPVKAKGKNKSTTFLPLKSFRETSDLSEARKVKVGALSPFLIMVGWFLLLMKKIEQSKKDTV